MTDGPLDIRVDDLSGEPTRALLRLHLQGMHANSPPGHVFALDLSGLAAPGVTVWSAWIGEAVAGIGALKDLGGGAGALKSMRTPREAGARQRGRARARRGAAEP